MSLDARVQLLRGDTTRAVNMMQAAIQRAGYSPASRGFFAAGPQFTYAVALSRTTQWRAEGIRRLRSYLSLGSFGVTVQSYMALAEALEADGNRAGAAEAYAHVIRLWKNADPHLQPVVQRAREALARLTGEQPRR
jgi:hypothetical protein